MVYWIVNADVLMLATDIQKDADSFFVNRIASKISFPTFTNNSQGSYCRHHCWVVTSPANEGEFCVFAQSSHEDFFA